MNPASNEAAGPQLPAPEQSPDISSDGEANTAGPASTEKAPAAAEKAPASGQAAPPILFPAVKIPLPSTTPQAGSQSSVPMTQASAAIVDDGDLIEKEWVHKAKQIVEANRDDPYKQSEELTVFKADYMKKRYDKNIKLSK